MKNIFKNTPNKCVDVSGEPIWLSRSVAVVGILIFRNIETHEDFILLEKRSQKMDQPLKWCVPCGYIDWDENGWECLVREVYEETNFLITEYKENIYFDNEKQPFFVNTNPSENRQNIALRHGIILNFDTSTFPLYVEKHKNEEIEEIKFVPLNEISKYDMAFHHDIAIKSFVDKYYSKILKINENK
jgi:8-oxo-dGTP pyrophosphatase MutT (NUDIX family)